MKQRFSLSRLLHNDRVIMVLSLALAVLFWALVVYGPSAVDKKTVTVPVVVKLNTAAESGQNVPDHYFSVLSQTVDKVDVTLSGNRSILAKVNAENVSVTADLTGIVNAVTDYEVMLEYKSTISGVSIVNTSKTSTKVTCDYLGSNTFPLSLDISGASLADESQFVFGVPVCELTKITVNGPKTVLDQIVSVKALVPTTKNLTDTAVLSADLKAYNEKGEELSAETLRHCSYTEAPNGDVPVTVIVQAHRKVNIQPVLSHAPDVFSGMSTPLTLTPAAIEFKGTADAVAAFQKYLEAFPIDFDNLLPVDNVCEIPLAVPDGITLIDDVQSIQAKLGLSVTEKKLDLELDTNLKKSGSTWSSGNVTVTNVPEGYTLTITQKKLSGVTLYGKSDSLSKLKNSWLKVNVDMKGQASAGPVEYDARIQISGTNAVWTYYGETAHALQLYITATAD